MVTTLTGATGHSDYSRLVTDRHLSSDLGTMCSAPSYCSSPSPLARSAASPVIDVPFLEPVMHIISLELPFVPLSVSAALGVHMFPL